MFVCYSFVEKGLLRISPPPHPRSKIFWGSNQVVWSFRFWTDIEIEANARVIWTSKQILTNFECKFELAFHHLESRPPKNQHQLTFTKA